MSNTFFRFKQFIVHQDRCAMKVTTDACLFGAWAAREVKSHSHETRNMLDIGVGTGLLTLMVAQKNPHLVIDGVEIDKDACSQAKENIQQSAFPNKIYLFNEDVRGFDTGRKYDVIICNPPFYENEIQSADPKKNVAHHGEALLLEALLPIIKSKMTATSHFYLLLPYKRRNTFDQLMKKNGLFAEKRVLVRQSVKHDHFRILISGVLFGDKSTEEHELSISVENGSYTEEFKRLLGEYYLRL
jgi:tRNA1Val (adenine37-N6)-methyltransferase